MPKCVANFFALSNYNNLTTPTLLQHADYKLGQIVSLNNSDKKATQSYMYIKAHTGLTAYQPYALAIGSTAGAEVTTAAPAVLVAPGNMIVVPQVAFTSGYYGFVLIQGDGKGLMTAETYAVGDMLQVADAGAAFLVDGSTGSTAYSVYTCAICKEAGTDAVARNIFLLNRWAETEA